MRKVVSLHSERFILYMDILGTKQITGSIEQTQLENVVDIFSSINSNFKIDYDEVEDDPTVKYQVNDIKPEISNFSDHIILSYPKGYQQKPYDSTQSEGIFIRSLIGLAVQLQREALQNSLLMRGAFNHGQLLHTGNSVIGTGLLDAINLEEKVAFYPRVIVTDQMVEIMKKVGLDPNLNYITRDFDGMYFIDYFKNRYMVGFNEVLVKSLTIIQNVIEKNLRGFENKSGELAKWRWLAMKFDEALEFYYDKEFAVKEEILQIPSFF